MLRNRRLFAGLIASALVVGTSTVPAAGTEGSARSSQQEYASAFGPHVTQKGVAAVEPRRRQARKTTFVLKVWGCNGCRISFDTDYRRHSFHWRRTKTLRNGQVRFTVPRKRINLASLSIWDPSSRLGHGETVMRYPGLRVGQVVPDPWYEDRAHGCWKPPKKRTIVRQLFTSYAYDDLYPGHQMVGLVMLKGVRTGGPSHPTVGRSLLQVPESYGFCG